MNQTDEQGTTATLENIRPLSLPNFLRQARQVQPEESTSRLPWLAFLKNFQKPPKEVAKSKSFPLKARKTARLPSGLTIEKTLEIVSGLETALNSFKPDIAPYPLLNPAEIVVEEVSSGLKVTLSGREVDEEGNRQREITRLFYLLVTGQELDPRKPEAEFKQLAPNYPHTVKVLRQGWQDGYSSTRQLSGAFGWSLFRWEHLPLTDAQIAEARVTPKPDKVPAVRQLELPQATDNRANTRGAFPTLLAFGSLSLGMALIVAFLVFSAANPPVTEQSITRVTPTPSPIPSPTAPLGLLNTRQADGATLTRLNPAYLTSNEQKYVNPEALAPGQAVLLNGQRSLGVVNAEWSLGQNVYLSLHDGGWEVWDTASGTRISRRELPDADQYAWVDWSPDGKNFAAQGFDGKVRLGTAGRVLRTFVYSNIYSPGERGFPFSWSPNSNYLLMRMGEGQYQFWNFQGSPQPVMTPANQAFLDLKAEVNYYGFQGIWSWSGDSRYISFYLGSLSNTVFIYDTRTLAKVAAISLDWPPQRGVGGVFSDQYFGDDTSSQGNFAWSPDSRYMALQRWNRNTNATTGNAANPVFQRTVTLWEVPTNLFTRGITTPVIPNEYQIIQLDNPDSASLVEWSRDGRLLLNSRQRESVNNSLVVKQNKLLVFAQDTGNNFNWTNSYTLEMPGQPTEVKGWWSLDGQRILVNTDLSYLAVYQLPAVGRRVTAQTIKIQVLAKSLENPVEAAVPSPDGRWLATYNQKTGPQLRDLKTGQVKASLTALYSGIPHLPLKWSPDSQYLTAIYSWLDGPSYNNRYKTVARIWKFDKATDQPEFYGDVIIPTNGNFVPRVDWNPKSAGPELLFEQDQNSVGTWQLTATPPLPLADQEKLNPKKSATPASATPPAPGQTDSGLVFQAFGLLPDRSNSPNFWLVPRAWFPEWQALVGPLDNTRNYGILKLQPPESSKTPEKIQFEPSTEQKPEKALIKAVAVSPDGRMIALGFDNGLIQLYNASNGKLFQAYTAHLAAIKTLSFSPDSKSLATASEDRTVKVWNTTNWKPTAVLRGQTQPVIFLQWLPSGPDSKILLAGGSYSGDSVVMWRVS